MEPITTKTKFAYINRTTNLVRRAKDESNVSSLTALQLAEWLIAKRGDLSKSTWRQYKAAVFYEFERQLIKRPSLSNNITTARDNLKNTPPPVGRPKIKKTAAKKAKKISEEDLITLFDYLVNENSRNGESSIQWLLSGLWTGLRPCEWERAFYIPSTGQLIVVNAKATQGRAHGANRTINLQGLDNEQLEIIEMHLENVRKAKLRLEKNGKSGFEQFYEQCRQRLFRANRKLWPKRKQNITLYTARHQFAANAKFNGLSKVVIAALMGHKSTDTQDSHYSRKSSGRSGFQVTANEKDVARVIELNKSRPQKSPPNSKGKKRSITFS
jgi:integrase